MHTIILQKFTTQCTIILYDAVSPENLIYIEKKIDTIISNFENEFSRFIPTTTISRLNNGEKVQLSQLFNKIFNTIQEYTYETM